MVEPTARTTPAKVSVKERWLPQWRLEVTIVCTDEEEMFETLRCKIVAISVSNVEVHAVIVHIR